MIGQHDSCSRTTYANVVSLPNRTTLSIVFRIDYYLERNSTMAFYSNHQSFLKYSKVHCVRTQFILRNFIMSVSLCHHASLNSK